MWNFRKDMYSTGAPKIKSVYFTWTKSLNLELNPGKDVAEVYHIIG